MKLPRVLVPLVAALAAVLPAAAGSHGDTSEKLAPLTWREQFGRVTLVVDAFPASFEGKENYVPLRIAMAMTDKGAPLTIGPESFTLIDADGGSMPVASYPAFAKGYGRRVSDETLFSRYPMQLDARTVGLRRLESSFFPAPGRETRTGAVQLAPFTWFQDVLYFPRPVAGLDGLMTLRLTAKGLDSPIEVRFRITENASGPAGGAQNSGRRSALEDPAAKRHPFPLRGEPSALLSDDDPLDVGAVTPAEAAANQGAGASRPTVSR